MTGIRAYYLSRVLIAAAFAAAFALLGAAWWQAALVGVAAIVWFWWAPRSGRYAVHPDRGVTALQRDERAERINAKAATVALVGVMLGVMAVSQVAKAQGGLTVSVRVLSYLLIGSALLYYAADVWLRRRG